jgi:hypothetical protein
VSKKIKKSIKSRKLEKKNRKIRTVKKPIRILKKLTGSVQFQFYKPETKKTESKPEKTRKKTKPNRFELVFVLKNKPKLVGLNRF